jgi:dihydrofolate reductase
METPKIPVVIVAALEKSTRAIGKNNQLLWHIPEDLKRFKALTLGHPIIMGKKTFLSIVAQLGKPLPGRKNIVITRDETYTFPADNVHIAHSLPEAFTIAEQGQPQEIHIGGGAEVYTQALPFVSRLHLTLIDDETVGSDAFFPNYTDDFVVTKEYPPIQTGERDFQWVDLVRTPKK